MSFALVGGDVFSNTCGVGVKTSATAGVEGDAALQLETSPLRMKMIGINFRGDTIRMGELILGSIGYSLS